MLKKIWLKLNNSTTGGAIIIAFFSVFSKILGLYRERLLAGKFSGKHIDILDAYFAAFKLPDLVFNSLVLGALASAFIPVFVRYLHRDKKEAMMIANSVLNILFVIILSFSIIFIIITPYLMPLVVPGFDNDKLNLTVTLTRIMFLSIIFFTVSNIFSGLLNSFKKFFTFSLAPIFYNLGIIFGILVFTKYLGVNGLAWGVVLGAILHLTIQLPEVLQNGWRWHLNFNWHHRGVKKIIKLMIPRTLGLAVMQVNQLVVVIIASGLTAGSIAYFNLANNLQSFPISVFGVSIALASFPVFSRAVAEKNMKHFKDSFSLNFRRILYLIIPGSIILLLLRAQVVRLILGTGSFTWENTLVTAQVLGFFSLSLFAQGLIPLLARTFYAQEDTKTPVLISIFTVIVNIIGSFILSKYFGIYGVALSFSFSAILQMILLLLILRIRIGYLDDYNLSKSTIRISLLSLFMGVVGYWVMNIVAPFTGLDTFIGVFLQTAITVLICIILYIFLSLLFNFEEVKMLEKYFGKYLNFLRFKKINEK